MVRGPDVGRFTGTAVHDSFGVAVLLVPARFSGSPGQHLDQALDLRQLQDCFSGEGCIERGDPHRITIDPDGHGDLRTLPTLDHYSPLYRFQPGLHVVTTILLMKGQSFRSRRSSSFKNVCSLFIGLSCANRHSIPSLLGRSTKVLT